MAIHFTIARPLKSTIAFISFGMLISCFTPITQNAEPQRVAWFKGREVKVTTVSNLLVTSQITDYSFFTRHYFSTYQSSVTEEARDYWNIVNVLADQVGSIFDTPAAENIININDRSEKVLGYFQAANQVFDRFFVVRSDLPFPILWQDCKYSDPAFNDYPVRCLNCLSVRNSSLVRPLWF